MAIDPHMLFMIRQLSSESLTELLKDTQLVSTQSEGLKLGHWVDAKALISQLKPN